ncbi:MAG: 3-deoxy-manno-octulosonate cytidylyltransferase [Paludibacteraceae bacterium]|nr:3-deoxy-manno-octulosonate cytidylyltransferase [Paludibacteraceae bacterium]
MNNEVYRAFTAKKCFGIIPARYASTRFPGKPLAEICGKTVIKRVYEQASKALDTVLVATDDDRIYDAVEAFGGKVVMTRPDHKCGTDRCLEAYQAITTPSWREQNDTDTIIINIQGDEPFIQPEQIETLLACFDKEDTQIATLVRPFTDKDSPEDLENVNTPKVDWNKATGEAKMFSRKVIACSDGTYYRHIGIYAFRADVLEQITRLPQSPLEKEERLEQLRWLENGYCIRVGVTDIQTVGIDTPEDLEKAIEWYKWNG